MARVRGTRPHVPSTEAAKENLRQLSQRIHQRRTRARETILYDLHKGVKTVEAQVHKQVEMVLSKLEDAPGSKYAFALAHTFLTQLPNALSNTILPSAISAVADTVAGRTTNSLTTLRGGLDEFDEDEDEEEEEEDDIDDVDDLEESSHHHHQQPAMMRQRHHHRQDSGVSHQLSNEFGTIALGCPSSTRPSTTSGMTISSAGASEFLSASTHHNYSTAASQVLSAALPSFIPSMVAPIVCVFSYPSPPVSKTNSPNQSSPSSPDMVKGKGVAMDSAPEHVTIKQEDDDEKALREAIRADPAIAEVTSSPWTSAEQEALFVAAARFKLQGQWSKIRQVMGLHRTDKEIEQEFERLYGDHDDDDDDEEMQDVQGEESGLVSIKKESVENGDADHEAEATVFMSFGLRPISPVTQQPVLMEIQSLPTTTTTTTSSSSNTGSRHHSHRPSHQYHHRSERHIHRRDDKHLLRTLNEKPLKVVKKEFLVDKRFTLEDIPMLL
ncbi:hypothetical protein BGX31_007167 [Mortierella sp. GBA43]|nr:hypothetical protein BGX31_007167 [Mortierella sp. GBA43]